MIDILDRGKYEKIKEGQEVKHTEKIVKFFEEMNKEIPPPLEIEGAKNMMTRIS